MWGIARPGISGTPQFDLSEDDEVSISEENQLKLTPPQVLLERVIMKTFAHYRIPLDVNDRIRASFKLKLWRMGKLFSKLGSKNRQAQLLKWKEGSNANWKFTVSAGEINDQVLRRKRPIEELKQETSKRMRFEQEVKSLKTTVNRQAKIIIQKGLQRRPKERKPLVECSRQQQHNRKKQMLDKVCTSMSTEGYDVCLVEVTSKDNGKHETLHIRDENRPKPINEKLCESLLVKDKFSVSHEAYHELSTMSDLPNLYQVKKIAKSLNSNLMITNCPNDCGVQQSLKARLLQRLEVFIHHNTRKGIDTPDIIRIKLTGDGTQIGRELKVINFTFTIIDEVEKAQSITGNYSLAILQTSESYDDLANGLQDICNEAKDIQVLAVGEKVYRIQFFLGGDLKFLALVCGIEAANADHSCIWCKCPKDKRSDMTEEWSITDQAKGARTIEEIISKSKLGKRNPSRYNCSHEPLFPFVPIERVVIDSLHMFLRISDTLTNLLIRDLFIHDQSQKTKYLETYKTFLNEVCSIRFKWNESRDKKELKYRDLTGPEKIRLFSNINIPSLFLLLPKKEQLQNLWSEFFRVMNKINERDCDPNEIDSDTKSWVRSFVSVYQGKDCTPYIHAFAMHTSQFIRLYGNVISFTQQGLEKLNDITTKHFQRATNHRGLHSLKQILEKRNRIELLQDGGYERDIQLQKCSRCKLAGHNKRTCKVQIPV